MKTPKNLQEIIQSKTVAPTQVRINIKGKPNSETALD